MWYRYGSLLFHPRESLCPLEELVMYIFSLATPIISWKERLLDRIDIL
jgi:hypothetical protein